MDHANDQTVLDLVMFLEWLDGTREVKVWAHPDETHEDTAKRYCAARTAV